MDVDVGLVAAVCRENMKSFLDAGMAVENLEGAGRTAMQFVWNYWVKYKSIPHLSIIHNETGVDLNSFQASEPVAYWADQGRDRNLYETLREELGTILEQMEQRKPRQALSDLESLVFRMRQLKPVIDRPKSAFHNAQEILDRYQYAKLNAGITGIPSPWPSINLVTKGWQKEQLVFFIARPGSGKTFIMLYAAKYAWKEGKKILMCSTEMPMADFRNRIASMVIQVPYSGLRDATLSDIHESKLERELKILENDPNFLIVGDGFDINLNTLEAAIIEEEPDLVCVDGIYLLKGMGSQPRDRHEQYAKIFQGVKSIAKRHKVPILATSQQNRSKDGKRGVDLERIAFTDAAGQLADYIFFLKVTEALKKEKKVELMPGKLREGVMLKNAQLHWDFGNVDINFEEVDIESERSSQDQAADVPPDEGIY